MIKLLTFVERPILSSYEIKNCGIFAPHQLVKSSKCSEVAKPWEITTAKLHWDERGWLPTLVGPQFEGD
jgi:hypothetical protein